MLRFVVLPCFDLCVCRSNSFHGSAICVQNYDLTFRVYMHFAVCELKCYNFFFSNAHTIVL